MGPPRENKMSGKLEAKIALITGGSSGIAVLVLSLSFLVRPATPTLESIPIPGTKAFPESITSTTDGTLYVGRLGDGGIVRVKPRTAESTIFVQSGASGSRSILGVFADEASNTLWACSNDLSDLGAPATGSDIGSALKAFDLKTGNGKRSVLLPGSHAFCNDITVDAKGSVYVTDSANPTILKLSVGRREVRRIRAGFRLFCASKRWCRARWDRLRQRRQPLRYDLRGWRPLSGGNQSGEGGAHHRTLGRPSTEISRCTAKARRQQFPLTTRLGNIRSRRDQRQRILGHSDIRRFFYTNARCPRRQHGVG